MSEQIIIKNSGIVLRDSLGEEAFNKVCNTFIMKMIYERTGIKAKKYLNRVLFKKIRMGAGIKIDFKESDLKDFKSQDVQDWLIRISDLEGRISIEIPEVCWEKLNEKT
jgi:hypothetical protein